MATSPTPSIKSRELIGFESFSKRRDVFGKHDTVFYPLQICLTPNEFERATERGTSVSRFRRTPAYSSMRETRREDIRNEIGFRERKMSDNYTSENQNDSVDYRQSLAERTKRISKLRHEFLTSNLFDTSSESPFTRSAARASLPARRISETYKIPDTSIYKFPFAEPYGTPSPTRKLIFDASAVDGVDSETPKKQILCKDGQSDTTLSLSELMKRYSPLSKPVNMTLPPTKPRVVSALPKPYSEERERETTEKLEIVETKLLENKESNDSSDRDARNCNNQVPNSNDSNKHADKLEANANEKPSTSIKSYPSENHQNNEQNAKKEKKLSDEILNGNLNGSSDEDNEKDDKVPEIPKIMRQDSHPKKNLSSDDTIPALLEKMERNQLVSTAQKVKRVKRKRSFLDKLLNRNKNKNK